MCRKPAPSTTIAEVSGQFNKKKTFRREDKKKKWKIKKIPQYHEILIIFRVIYKFYFRYINFRYFPDLQGAVLVIEWKIMR